MARKSKTTGKRYPLNMRTTKEVRERLESAAAESGRSLVQEVEHRIETSLADDSILKGLGGPNAGAILRPLLFFFGSLNSQGVNFGWQNRPVVADAVHQALSFIIEAATAREAVTRDKLLEFLNPADKAEKERIIFATAALTAQAFGLADIQPVKGSGASVKTFKGTGTSLKKEPQPFKSVGRHGKKEDYPIESEPEPESIKQRR